MEMMGIIMMALFSLTGGNTGDLLDYTKTDTYWQAPGKPEMTLANMQKVVADKKAASADKLMAIRALGEMGKKLGAADKAKLVTTLTPLVKSKEPFVGRYAKRSIAWLKGVDPEKPAKPTIKQLDADLALLPKATQIVGQLSVGMGAGPVDLGKLIPLIPGAAPQRDMMLAQLSGAVMEVAGKIGNARVEAITVGATFIQQPGGSNDDGYAVIIVRGKYDRISAQLGIQDLAKKEKTELDLYSIGDVEVITPANKMNKPHFALLMPSNELFVAIVGEVPGGLQGLPIADTAKRLAAKNNTLQLNAEVAKQVKQVDRKKAALWVAMEVPLMMKNDAPELFGAFKAGHASATLDAKGAMQVKWAADGDDPTKVKAAVEYINREVSNGIAELRQELPQIPPQMRPMMETGLKVMESIKAQAKGKTMTGGMKLPKDTGAMMQMMFMGMMSDFEVEPEPAPF